MSEMNADRINALRCAVEVLAGDGGGYTEERKYEHKITLWNMLMEAEAGTIPAPSGERPERPEKPVIVVHKSKED